MNRSIFYSTLLSAALVAGMATSSVSAQSYGSTPTPSESISIDKAVTRPGTSDYVDNLSVSDTRYSANQEVMFRLIVKNTSDREIKNVRIVDTMPQYVDLLEGSLDQNIGTLKAGEEKTYYIKARTVEQNVLPDDRSVICLLNKVTVTGDRTSTSGSVSDVDSSQFCVEKEVSQASTTTTVTKVPAAGMPAGMGLVALQIAGIALGVTLKKKIAA
jgi:uncharacterized repeat protein (TIGR01451 family)